LAILFFWQSRPPSIGINGKVANPSGSPVQVVSTPPFAPPSPVPSGLSNQTVAISSASMAPVVNLAGRWQITQSNGSVVDVSMKQEGDRLSAFCTHSNGSVRSTDASGTVRGDSMILTITWDDGTKGEYTGRLETGHFARINEGILKGTTRDLFHPTSTATWEVMDRVFLRP